MTTSHDCPLCSDSYEEEPDLRVHLEVEHRKSELAMHLVRTSETRGDPTVRREREEESDREQPAATF